MHYLFALVFMLTSLSSSNAAEVSISPVGNFCYFSGVVIDGPIEIGDSEKFKSELAKFKIKAAEQNCAENSAYAIINSTGGNVDESMEIGFEIRRNALGVIIPKNKICYSSCVFILAAGVHKLVAGNVGIHRPYFSNLKPGQSIEDVRKIREAANGRIKSYLSYVDVPASLLEDMLAYPPESIKILNDDDLLKYRLTGKDATKDEIDTAESASFYNLSSAEYRQRIKIYEKKMCLFVSKF